MNSHPSSCSRIKTHRRRILGAVGSRCSGKRRLVFERLENRRLLAIIHVPGDQPTINGALGVADPGDEIVVADGAYTENVNINNMSPQGDITIRAANPGMASLINTAAANPTMIASNFTGDIVISGMVLDALSGTEAVIQISNVAGLATVDGNRFGPTDGSGFGGFGIIISTGGTTETTAHIINNVFDNTLDNESAVFFEPDGNSKLDFVVDQNTFEGLNEDAVEMDWPSGPTLGAQVSGRITDNSMLTWDGSGEGIDLSLGRSGTDGVLASLLITGNQIGGGVADGPDGNGIEIFVDGSNTEVDLIVSNNTIAHAADAGILVDSRNSSDGSTVNVLIDHNSLSDSGDNGIEVRPESNLPGTADTWNIVVAGNEIAGSNAGGGEAALYLDADDSDSNYTLNIQIDNNDVMTPSTGDYVVDQAGSTVNVAFTNNRTDSESATLTVSSGSVNQVADPVTAGWIPGSLGDFVWDDQNGNGIQDSGEPGVPGVIVTLTGTRDVDSATVNFATTSDPSGVYLLPALLKGTYTVTVELPGGFDAFSPQDAGGDPTKDSDVDGSGVVSVAFDGSLGSNLDLDVGLTTVPATAWTNPSNRLDVDDNGVVTPADALHIINEVNIAWASDETGLLPDPPVPPLTPPPYFDTDGDGYVSAADVHLVVNYLNEQVSQAQPALAEGEFPWSAPVAEGEPVSLPWGISEQSNGSQVDTSSPFATSDFQYSNPAEDILLPSADLIDLLCADIVDDIDSTWRQW